MDYENIERMHNTLTNENQIMVFELVSGTNVPCNNQDRITHQGGDILIESDEHLTTKCLDLDSICSIMVMDMDLMSEKLTETRNELLKKLFKD